MQMHERDLTFPNYPYGSHQVPWNLRILFYKGAAEKSRKEAASLLEQGHFKEFSLERAKLVCAFHEAFLTLIAQGSARSSIETYLETLWRFYSWADTRELQITKKAVIDTFKEWTEYQLWRFKVKKIGSAIYSYRQSMMIANLITKALLLPGLRPAKNLMAQTRMRKPSSKKKVLGTDADKQNLENTFEFGRCLKKICDDLDLSKVRGELPINIEISASKNILLLGNIINPDLDVLAIRDAAARRIAENVRRALLPSESLMDKHKRSKILNVRIEAELLIFVAQTGINVTQSAGLRRENFRWRTVGEGLEVFRVYKGRRDGEAIFRCYKAYKLHLEKYLKWLDETGLSKNDQRLFPIISRGIIPAAGSKVRFNSIRPVFKDLEISFIGPRELRKTRVNWLLRRSKDADLTAEQMAHSKQNLLQNYEAPHHQSAVAEIVKFHTETDRSIQAPGPGMCASNGATAKPLAGIGTSKDAPQPDCISPEGCLFCVNHRDIMTFDYCWKLASHMKIKNLEVSLYKPSKNQEVHPGVKVIEIITAKLEAISRLSEVRSLWVKESYDNVRSGKYHPDWDGHIKLLELLV